jgi:NADH dehydrogenase
LTRLGVELRLGTAVTRCDRFGNLATIGRKEAVVDFGRLKLTGRIAWLVWGLAHIYFLIGFRNRMAVAVDWLWSYLTYQRGARLITGQEM